MVLHLCGKDYSQEFKEVYRSEHQCFSKWEVGPSQGGWEGGWEKLQGGPQDDFQNGVATQLTANMCEIIENNL